MNLYQAMNIKAKLDFTNKTIEFEGDFKLSDIHLIQESLKDWQGWRIVKPVTVTVTPYTYPTIACCPKCGYWHAGDCTGGWMSSGTWINTI